MEKGRRQIDIYYLEIRKYTIMSFYFIEIINIYQNFVAYFKKYSYSISPLYSNNQETFRGYSKKTSSRSGDKGGTTVVCYP